MSITLELPEELENELSAEAARLGLSLPEYVLRVVSTNHLAGDRPKNGTELVAYWRGAELIGARADVSDSQSHARQIRERAESRRRK